VDVLGSTYIIVNIRGSVNVGIEHANFVNNSILWIFILYDYDL